MQMPKTRIVLGFLVVIALAFFTWVSFQPRHGRPNVSIKLLGYTNDTSGTRVAMIAVTNLSAFTIFIYRPNIEISAPSEPGAVTHYWAGRSTQWYSKLGRGAFGNFTIPPPTNQSPWRLSFLVYTDLGTVQVIKNLMRGGRYMPFQIEGNWIDSQK
jgi:hypothetical protein